MAKKPRTRPFGYDILRSISRMVPIFFLRESSMPKLTFKYLQHHHSYRRKSFTKVWSQKVCSKPRFDKVFYKQIFRKIQEKQWFLTKFFTSDPRKKNFRLQWQCCRYLKVSLDIDLSLRKNKDHINIFIWRISSP